MSKERAAQLVEAGIWLKLSGDVEGAQKLFQRALKLDPENDKAKQLLAPVAAPSAPPPVAEAPPPPPPAPLPPANPFERPVEARPPSPTETEWGLATGFGTAPAAGPVQVNLEDDWGRFTGASTPVPATATPAAPLPPAPLVVPGSDSGLRAGGGADAPAPRHTMVQFSAPGQPSAGPAPRHPMMQFPPTPAEGQGAAPRHPMMQFQPTLAEGQGAAPRNTMMQFPPTPAEGQGAAPRHTMMQFPPAPAEGQGAAPRHTMMQFPPAPAEGQGAAPRNTMMQFPPPPAEGQGAAPRHTMVQFPPAATQAQGVGAEPLSPSSAARPPAEVPRHTMVQFSLPEAARSALGDFSLPPAAAAPLALEPLPPPPASPEGEEPMFAVDVEPLAPVAEFVSPTPFVAATVASDADVPWSELAPPRLDVAPPPLAPPAAEVASVAAPPKRTTGVFGRPTEEAPPAPRPPVKRSTGMWGIPSAEPEASQGGWFSESGADAPQGWELPPPPQPAAPVLEAVNELVPAPEVVAVPVPPPPVPERPPVPSVPVYSSTPVPAVAGAEMPLAPPPAPSMPFDVPSPPPIAAPEWDLPVDPPTAMFGDVPPPLPSAPGVRPDLGARDALFGTGGLVPVPSPPEPAWAWSGASAPPDVSPAEWAAPPEPRPSPNLAPSAESAWDQRNAPGVKLPVVPGRDKALDLISSDSKISRPPEARTAELQAILKSARNLLDLDDHTGAMELIVKAEALAPDDLEVKVLKERSERTLLTMLESKLGPLTAVPRVLLKDDEIIWLNLDHRAGFVLAQIDGAVTFDDLFSVSGMTRLDTARILAQLVDEGVISRG